MQRIIPAFGRLANLLLVVALLCPACRDKEPAQTPGKPRPASSPRRSGPALKAHRVAVLGASLSAGVGARPLATLLRSALPKDAVVIDCSDALLFENPWGKTPLQLRKAQAAKADTVVALDVLFWFAYHNRSEREKTLSLDAGLKQLERVKVPLFLGDLPDMRSASPALIPRAQIPSAAVLARLNQRIHAWALARPNVHLLPFSAWSKPLRGKGRIVTAPGQPSIPAADALHIDGLHPNGKGTLYLLHRTLVSIRRAYPGTDANRFRLSPELIRDLTKL